MSVGIAISGFEAIAQVAAAHLIDSLVRGAALAVIAALLLAATRRYGARLRFVVWFSVLVAIAAGLLLPFFRHTGGESGMPLRVLTLPDSWATYLFAVWLVIASMALLRVMVGAWRVRRLRRTCSPVDVRGLPTPVQLTLARRSGRRINLCKSPAVEAPTAVGFIRPAIIIPATLMDELSPEDLNHIVLHELAHIRRWDDWTNLAQKVIGALLFFHPVVWWIERRIALEREMACDEAVVAATANPRAYAQCLAFLAERSLVRRSLHLVQAAVGRMRQTTARVAKILGGSDASVAPLWKAAIPVVALFVTASAALIAGMPDLVAFKNPVPTELPPADIATAHVPRPVLAATRTPVESRTLLDETRPRVRPALAKARVTKPAVTLAATRSPRVSRPAQVRGDVVLVVFEQGQQSFAGISAWQVRVWQVTLVRQVSQAQKSTRKVI